MSNVFQDNDVMKTMTSIKITRSMYFIIVTIRGLFVETRVHFSLLSPSRIFCVFVSDEFTTMWHITCCHAK